MNFSETGPWTVAEVDYSVRNMRVDVTLRAAGNAAQVFNTVSLALHAIADGGTTAAEAVGRLVQCFDEMEISGAQLQAIAGGAHPQIVLSLPGTETLVRDQMILNNRRRAWHLRQRVAARRARLLLNTFLTPEQSRQLEKEQCFRVESRDGKRAYVIRETSAYNVTVDRVDEQPGGEARAGEVMGLVEGMTLCVVLRPVTGIGGRTERAPLSDHLLAQAMLLSGGVESEIHFLKWANYDY